MPRVVRINHIGLATSDTLHALDVFGKALGLPVGGTDELASDAVRATFLPVGDARLEFLEPIDNQGPVQKFLDNRGPGIHHICLEVEDLAGMLGRLKAHGVELIDEEPRAGAHGSMVAFVHPKSANGVLIELVESGTATKDD